MRAKSKFYYGCAFVDIIATKPYINFSENRKHSYTIDHNSTKEIVCLAVGYILEVKLFFMELGP